MNISQPGAELNEKIPARGFITAKEWFFLASLTLVGFLWNWLPYSSVATLLFQTVFLGTIFLIYRRRPAMMIVAYVLLAILPERMYGGFLETFQNFYRLNAKVCIAFALLFFLYGLIFLRRKYKINLSLLLFVVIMVCSITWTMDTYYYNLDFWWMCTAYLLFPLFIHDDKDLRVILMAYILAVDAFCISVLPDFISNTLTYRGWVNLDPNYAALFVIFSVAVILIMFMQYKEQFSLSMKLFLIASVVIALVTMVYFESRTAAIMAVFLLVAYLFFNVKNLKIFLFSMAGFLILFLILNNYGVLDPVLLRFAESDASTAGGRLIIQKALLDSIYHFSIGQLMFGNGYLTTSFFGVGDQAHNTYTSITIAFGLVGLTIYLVYLWEIFLTLLRSQYRPFLLMFFGLCFYGFSLEPYLMIEGILLFCLLTGIMNFVAPAPIDKGEPDVQADEVNLVI